MTEDAIKALLAERTFLESQNHKLATIIRQQEEQIMDLRMANQDLKFQLSELHEKLNLKDQIDQIDDGRC
jgi:chromosome segregation ATPase